MAKSTYLQLSQALHRACGLTGSGPAAVTAQTGMSQKLVEWVQLADLETQSRWLDWDFLHYGDWTVDTVANDPAIAAPADVGTWDVDSFYLDYSTASHKHLGVIDYKTWRRDFRQGVKTSQMPDSVVIKPDLSLILEGPPDGVYALTADYWERPAKMTENGSTSPIPEEYERIIITRARMMYAEHDGAGDVLMAAQIEFDDLLDKLEAKYLPSQRGRRMSDPGQMTVRPE